MGVSMGQHGVVRPVEDGVRYFRLTR